MKRLLQALLLVGAAITLVISHVNAAPNTNLFMVDEFGGGLNLTENGQQTLFSTNAMDPTGGLFNWPVLTFTLPFLGTAGDVLMHEPLQPGSPVLDVLRFDGQGHLIFYSDNLDGFDAPADTPGMPDPLLANTFDIVELGNATFAYGSYIPTTGQPGWDASAPNYAFISEGVVPEPQVSALLVTSLGVLGWARMRRKQGPSAAARKLSRSRFISLLCLLAVGSLSINRVNAEDATPAEIGLAIGQQAPAFTLTDQNGKQVSLDSLLKNGPVAIVFYRSADWCMYCKMRLIQIQRNLGELQASGLQVVGISYDSLASVKRFADGQKIAFPLLSDVGSKTIEAYAMLNKAEGDGTANHGIIVLGKDGVVRAKLFPVSHDDREVMDQLLGAFKEAQRASGGNKS